MADACAGVGRPRRLRVSLVHSPFSVNAATHDQNRDDVRAKDESEYPAERANVGGKAKGEQHNRGYRYDNQSRARDLEHWASV